MKKFIENRPYIENEFENAKFDVTTGISADVLIEKLRELQNTLSEECRQIFCAKAYAYLLDNVQLEINEHTPFSVKINVGVDYSYFATADIFAKALFNTQRDKILHNKLEKEYEYMKNGESVGLGYIYTDFWHTVPDWTNIIKYGFSGILEKARNSKAKITKSAECKKSQLDFLDSVIICYEAIIRLLNRIYEYSLKFDVPEFSQCIKNLTTNPPQTLYEVMQLSILYLYFEEIGTERGRTLGPVDRMYLPFFENDIKNGINEEELKDLFRYFFIHFTATKRYAEQPFTICGSDEFGNDLSNNLSLMLLEIYDELNIYDPKIQIRYHTNLDNRIFKKALSMIRGGHSSICIVNDDAVFAGYERIGIPKKDAQDYVILGCYEPIIMGREEGEIAPVRLNIVKFLEFALNGGKDILTGKQIGFESKTDIESFEELFEIYLKQLDEYTEFALEFLEKQGKYNTLINPSPIYSSSFSDCIEKGMDVHEYPLKYNNLSLKHIGIATVVDSLVAIKKYVFEKQEISLEELRNALAADWKGYEGLQNRILNDREKYGNNLAVPDEIMQRITKHLEHRYCGRKLKRGGVLRLGLDSVYHCVTLGEKTAATPDGRKAGMPFSKNLCASDGMDRGGITSYMQSVLKIDSKAYVNALIFDFILHPSAVEGEKGLQDFESLLKIYFANGGFAAQGNVVSSDILREAQRNPRKYATLQVRVCGWNEYFVKLSKVKQDMFIKQSEVK